LLGPPNIKPLVVLLRSHDNDVLGGLWGRMSFGWFFLELLFVPERFRGFHLGKELLKLAEAKAKERGCVGAWLDTFSASARRFYETNGYATFGANSATIHRATPAISCRSGWSSRPGSAPQVLQ
jgi:GNAT superfamily N-acetyltransferase